MADCPLCDHHAVAQDNVADMSCNAHRAGLHEARDDEKLREWATGILFLRLTKTTPPLALPVSRMFNSLRYTSSTATSRRASCSPNRCRLTALGHIFCAIPRIFCAIRESRARAYRHLDRVCPHAEGC
jgi:hypothetical protein